MIEKKANWFKRAAQAMKFADSTNKPTTGDRTIILHADPLGSSGTRNFSGYDQEEYLYSLKGFQRANEFDKMRRSDPTVIMLLNAVKNLIRSAVMTIEPGVVTDQMLASGFTQDMANSDSDLLRHMFLCDMDTSASQFLNEALTMIDFGHSVFEITQKIVQNNSQFGTYVGLKSLGWRSPRTIYRWNLNPDTGALVSVSQMAWGDLARLVDIPAQFLMVMTMNREGSNFEGISWLRPCYGPYQRKKTAQKLNIIGIEKFAIPTPMAEIPQGDANSQQYANLVDVLENFVAHESNYITFPVGWKVTLVPNTYDPSKVEASVDAEDRRMTNAFLANFLNLGQGSSGGAYALSNDLSDFFTAGIEHIATNIEQEFNRAVAVPMIKVNKGMRPVYPTLKLSGISDKAGLELANSIKDLVSNKVIIPDDNLENHIRERYGLPKSSKEGQRQVSQPGQQQAGPFGMSENRIYEKIRLAEQRRKR